MYLRPWVPPAAAYAGCTNCRTWIAQRLNSRDYLRNPHTPRLGGILMYRRRWGGLRGRGRAAVGDVPLLLT